MTKVFVVLLFVHLVVCHYSCFSDEVTPVPIEFDRNTPLGSRVAEYVKENDKCPGINAFSDLLVGTTYNFEVETAVMLYIDQVMDSQKRIPEIKEVRRLFRTRLEPLSYTANVTLIDTVGKTRSVSRDSVATDGYRVKYLRDGLHDHDNSERTLSGHGFDGDFYYRYDATVDLASGYVGFPPTSRSMFFPRSHLVQRLFLSNRSEDLLGDESSIAMNLDMYSGYIWNYDGPAINGKKNLIAYGDPRSYLILDIENYYSFVGGFSGRVTVEQQGSKSVYVSSNSYSSQTTQGEIQLESGGYIPEAIKNSVFQDGKEVYTEKVEVIELSSGEELSKGDFDVIPNGVAVMNEVDNLGYIKGGAKQVPLVVENSISNTTLAEDPATSNHLLLVLLNIVAIIIFLSILAVRRRPRNA